MKRVLITGGAGFIGRHLAASLVNEGMQVSVLDNFANSSRTSLHGLNVELTEGDVLDKSLVNQLVDGSDCVVHLAARGSVSRSLQYPEDTFRNNVEGTVCVARAAAESNAYFVLASSSSVYGSQSDGPAFETAGMSPQSPYAASKAAAEMAIGAMQKSMSLRALVVRFFNVYGEFQNYRSTYAAVVPRFIVESLKVGSVQMEGDGQQTRDFTYVGDVTQILLQIIESQPRSSTAVNVAGGRPRSIADLRTAIEREIRKPISVNWHPPRPGDIQDSCADNSLLLSILDSPFSFTALEHVLPGLINHYRDALAVGNALLE